MSCLPSSPAALAFLLALTALLAPSHARAQQQQQRAPARLGSSPEKSDVNLPAWARPSEAARQRPSQPQASVHKAPGTPTTPTFAPAARPVPLGGLEWLALAGGAYAVSRLRRNGKDDDADDGDDPLP